MLAQIANIVHYLIIIWILSIPFQPLSWIRYTFFCPWIIQASWWLFGGLCPLSIAQGVEHFVHWNLSQFMDISVKQADLINNFVLLTVPTIAGGRIIHRYWNQLKTAK
jgi:hypothetical protein